MHGRKVVGVTDVAGAVGADAQPESKAMTASDATPEVATARAEIFKVSS